MRRLPEMPLFISYYDAAAQAHAPVIFYIISFNFVIITLQGTRKTPLPRLTKYASSPYLPLDYARKLAPLP